ncbi:MAG: hypothetical protein WCA77_00885 [Thermoplasmata archaeon]
MSSLADRLRFRLIWPIQDTFASIVESIEFHWDDWVSSIKLTHGDPSVSDLATGESA